VKKKMKIKEKLSIFVIAILALSLAMPLVSVLAILEPAVDPAAGPYYVGDTLTLTGSAGEVTSGSQVNVYWDIASGSGAWLLNTTTGNPDGSYEVMIDIPDTDTGDHYVWVKDVATASTNGDLVITVSPEVDTDISSGLPGDEVEITGTGFGDEAPVNITFYNATDSWNVVPFGDEMEANEFGTFVVLFDIPAGIDYGVYSIDGNDNTSTASTTFTVGASIKLTPDEGPTGSIVRVEGRGWTPTATVTFTLDGSLAEVVDGDTITVASDGEFSADVVIPYVGPADDYDLEATESGALVGPADDSFEVTGIPEISVDPTYGSPGAVISVTGANFSRVEGTDVALELWGKAPDPVAWIADLGTAETDENGMIDDSFVSPAVAFTSYDVRAVDTVYIDRGTDVDDPFKVGLIALIINPTSGTAGTELSITGIGFEPGLYNLTFGDEENADYGTVSAGEAIADNFWVPNVEPGTYDVLVVDIAGNELAGHFTVTDTSHASMDPAVAPNDYNITISGYNFADDVADVTFDIYNSTDDWSMTVMDNGLDAATNSDGNFSGWWLVDPILGLGDYTVNITDGQGLMVQLDFSVVAARVDVLPTKPLYDRGDTLKFDISNDFDLPDSYLKIYSPDDILWWITDPLTADMWIQPDMLYTVPYYRQVANENPMDFASDAPMGTWTYVFFDDGNDELRNGTFNVGPSTAAQVDELLDEVRTDIESLASDVAGVTDDIKDDIDALSGEIGDVASDVDNLRDEIVGDLADDIASATAAANAAGDAVDDLESSLGDLEDSVGDIADTADSAETAANAAADAAADAASAAEDASSAASGLTTLVYGAIGASLIAALAAIVSLMQISRRIAG
jgi:hypothetical protein